MSEGNSSSGAAASASQAVSEPSKCMVCLGLADESTGPLIQAEHCGHEFHQECLRSWLLEQARCPLCNKRQRRPEETPEEAHQRQINEAEAARQRLVADGREAVQLAQHAAAEDEPDAEDEEREDEEGALEFQQILFLSAQGQGPPTDGALHAGDEGSTEEHSDDEEETDY